MDGTKRAAYLFSRSGQSAEDECRMLLLAEKTMQLVSACNFGIEDMQRREKHLADGLIGLYLLVFDFPEFSLVGDARMDRFTL